MIAVSLLLLDSMMIGGAMKQEMKSTARLAVTAGLCASLALGGMPLEAIASEVLVDSAPMAMLTDEPPAAHVGDAAGESAVQDADAADTNEADTDAADVENAGEGLAADASDAQNGNEATAQDAAEARNGLPPAAASSSVPDADAKALGVARVIAADGAVRGSYDSLSAAIEAAKDGDTIQILEDTNYVRQDIKGKNLKVDLCGHTLTSTRFGFTVEDGSLELDDTSGEKTGLINVVESGVTEVGVVLNEGGRFVMKGGSIVSADRGVHANKGSEIEISIEGGSITAPNGIFAAGKGAVGSTKIIVKDGHITGKNAGIITNGGSPGGVVIDISGGTIESDATAVFVPGVNGRTTITGGTISGATGVEVRAGNLMISGDPVISGHGELKVGASESGATTTGMGVAVAQHVTLQPINVFIEGNPVITGKYALYEHNPQNNPQDKIDQVSVKIAGGTFESLDPSAKVAVYSEDVDGFISGGTFKIPKGAAVDEDAFKKLCAPGYVPQKDVNGNYTVEVAEEKRVAEVGGRAYLSVQEALDAAKDGDTVKLLKDATENVEVAKGASVVLDLAGCTLSGGTVASKAALTNYGTVVVKDSSSEGTGQIVREDKGVPAYYVIDNQGTMTFESGTVYNNAGDRKGSGSSLVRNAGLDTEAHLTIKGGTFKQENFIVIKNDDHGVLEMVGGEIVTSKRDGNLLPSAVQNWGSARLTGGTITGAVWTSVWKSDFPASKTLIGGNVVVDGEITADVTGSGVSTVPRVEITGGTIKNKENGFNIKGNAELVVSGGSFNAPVDVDYCAPDYGPVELPDGSFGVSTEQSYTVRHLFESVDSDAFVEDESLAKPQIMIGKIGGPTNAEAQDVPGFTAASIDQKEIAADGSTVVEVMYTRTRHTVSFDSKGGGAAAALEGVKYGARVAEPVAPTKEGSTFLGWYVAGTLDKFDFNKPITGDVQLVAHWVLKLHTVSFDVNGGEEVEPLEISHGYELPSPVANRRGYELIGWKNAAGEDVKFPITVTGDLTLTAQWRLNAPAVALTADKLEPGVHAGDTVVLTANPVHELPGVTYTYQWYKGRTAIDGATAKTLEVAKDGEYTVDVVAHDGDYTSTAATSNPITLTFEKQGVVVSFAESKVEKHASEVGATFVNGITLSARAVGKVSYTSSNPQVATVDASMGKVAIKGVGEATITALVAETDTHLPAEASYKLVVTDHDAGTWQTVRPATCAEEGLEQRVCGVCGDVLETRQTEKLKHEVVHTAAKDATCVEDGNIEHWTCKSCGKIFADSVCANEIKREDTVVKATGHNLEAVAEVPASIDAPGTKAHYKCSSCGGLFLDAEGTQKAEASDLVIE